MRHSLRHLLHLRPPHQRYLHSIRLPPGLRDPLAMEQQLGGDEGGPGDPAAREDHSHAHRTPAAEAGGPIALLLGGQRDGASAEAM